MTLGKPESCPCPICDVASVLDSYDEVDLGIGAYRGNYVWDCPEHARWCVLDRPYFNGHAFYFGDLDFRLFRAHPRSKNTIDRVHMGTQLTESEWRALFNEYGYGGCCGCDGALDAGCPLCTEAQFRKWLREKRASLV